MCYIFLMDKNNEKTLIFFGLFIAGVIIFAAIITGNSNDTSTTPKSSVTTNLIDVESDCKIRADEFFDKFEIMRNDVLSRLDSTTMGSATHYSHYNKAQSACFVSISEVVNDSKFNEGINFFWLFNVDTSTQTQGPYPFIAKASLYSNWRVTNQLTGCEVNSLPCSSIEEYTNRVNTYLNN